MSAASPPSAGAGPEFTPPPAPPVAPPSRTAAWYAPPVLPRPVGARRGWALVGSIALVLVSIFFAMLVFGQQMVPDAVGKPVPHPLAVVGFFVMLPASVLLVWRHRWPVPITIGLIALALILPTTPLAALIALAAATAVTAGWLRWSLIGAAWVAVLVQIFWELSAVTSLVAVATPGTTPGSPERLAYYGWAPVLAALAVLPFAAYGIIRRLLIERDLAELGTAAATRTTAALHQEVAVERHRQEIARELHDTLASRLSTLSLHAGALELSVDGQDPKTAAAARAVRQSAQHSLDDLRNVVQALRNPDAQPGASTGLADIATLIDDALRAGTDVRAQVLVTDPTSCAPEVAHAAFRIVQETISNVQRHAPGASLFLEVKGDPETGLTLRASNWLAPEGTAPVTRGGGNGLTGMSERAIKVGGTLQAGPTPDGGFSVVAWLPWAPR